MFKCCVCGKQLDRPTSYVCGVCAHRHQLALREEDWPAWARSELQRERSRRRFKPSYGVSGRELRYAPYSRRRENQSYRQVNRVRKAAPSSRKRIGAENLLYSTSDGPVPPETVCEQVFGTLPAALQTSLGRGHDLAVVLADAVAALPLVSQRAIRAYAMGYTLTEIAQAEGLSDATMDWLLTSARERLRDILTEKVGGDDGMRYRPT